MECVACTGWCEPPFTFVEDAASEPTGQVVYLACLDGVPARDEAADTPAELGGEG